MIVWNNSQSISVKYENNDYEINSMEQISMIFLRLSEHKNTRKGGIRTEMKSSANNVDGNIWHTWHYNIKTYQFTFISKG